MPEKFWVVPSRQPIRQPNRTQKDIKSKSLLNIRVIQVAKNFGQNFAESQLLKIGSKNIAS
jgi:hypothetical protein